MKRFWTRTLSLLASAGIAACSNSSAIPAAREPFPANARGVLIAPATPIGNYIKHVVIIVQENRSFNNIFAGYPGAVSAMYGYTHKGKKIRLRELPDQRVDVPHGYGVGRIEWDHGKMDGFDIGSGVYGHHDPTLTYSYLDRKLTKPYWWIAHNYVLADHMFDLSFGGSFQGHLGLIIGNLNIEHHRSLVDHPNNAPWGCDAPAGTVSALLDPQQRIKYDGPFPCFTQFHTIAETLDAANISWKYYAPDIAQGDSGRIWSEFEAIKQVRHGPDWNKVVSPPPTVLHDVEHGKLPQVAWVIPRFSDSDHSGGSARDDGPSWVANLINTIGHSKYWNDTAIFVTWDEWGGWFDPVPPPQLDFRGLGIRVPFMIVSPYARKGVVDHTLYESASTLRFIEDTFGLPRLGKASDGYTDGRANSPVDAFDFTQPPRAFTTIPAPPWTPHAMDTDTVPPDDDEN